VIAIVDYGIGNLASVKKAITHLGHACEITSSPELVARSRRIVLPGVGHFAATEQLTNLGLRDAIIQATNEGALLLGICVGMQWMFAGSTEAPGVPGLGAFRASCERFAAGIKVPHVGWNSIEMRAPSRLLQGIPSGSFVYYTHSFRAPLCEGVVAESDYAGRFAAVIERDNLFGVQFHPEKSASAGLRMLENFCELPC
jgi:glutamine amidotransferase